MTHRTPHWLFRIVLGLWLGVILAAFSAAAQSSPLSPAEEHSAETDVDPEAAQLEQKVSEARARLEEWRGYVTEYVLAGKQA